jgi:hypothetical protein
MKRILWMVTLLVSFATGSQAATIPIGFVFFQGVNPDFNFFSIANQTGDPADGGSASEDFPIFTSIVFTDSMLTVVRDEISTTLSIGDIGPGPGPDFLEFLRTDQISSATFSASINSLLFTLSDGSAWVADSHLLSATVLPSESRAFLSEFDFVLLTVEASAQAEPPAPVPEPSTALLVASGIAGLAARRKRNPGKCVTTDDPSSAA